MRSLLRSLLRSPFQAPLTWGSHALAAPPARACLWAAAPQTGGRGRSCGWREGGKGWRGAGSQRLPEAGRQTAGAGAIGNRSVTTCNARCCVQLRCAHSLACLLPMPPWPLPAESVATGCAARVVQQVVADGAGQLGGKIVLLRLCCGCAAVLGPAALGSHLACICGRVPGQQRFGGNWRRRRPLAVKPMGNLGGLPRCLPRRS